MATTEKDHYATLAATYNAIEELPQSALYQEDVKRALGSCSGKTILDLGGGTGLHARNALALGATLVDIVDISPAMLSIGQNIDPTETRLRWHVGDISQPLDELPLEREGYDVTMVNWTFDHASTLSELEGMWSNTAKYTKKGGKLISIRMANPCAASAKDGKYGISFSEIEPMAGGLKYVYTAHIEPPLSCPATTLSESMDFEKAKLMARRFGFGEWRKVVEEEGEVVGRNPEFWAAHLEDPVWICVEATKIED
jgi:ubiquinone/menaquinone biosynthesis C-methylase UbiE